MAVGLDRNRGFIYVVQLEIYVKGGSFGWRNFSSFTVSATSVLLAYFIYY